VHFFGTSFTGGAPQARIEKSGRAHMMVDALEARDAEELKRVIALHIRQPADAQT